MTVRYCEILRLDSISFSRRNIALSVPCSRNTVAKTLNRAKELGISWPLPDLHICRRRRRNRLSPQSLKMPAVFLFQGCKALAIGCLTNTVI